MVINPFERRIIWNWIIAITIIGRHILKSWFNLLHGNGSFKKKKKKKKWFVVGEGVGGKAA